MKSIVAVFWQRQTGRHNASPEQANRRSTAEQVQSSTRCWVTVCPLVSRNEILIGVYRKLTILLLTSKAERA
jgi:hypothetical protein